MGKVNKINETNRICKIDKIDKVNIIPKIDKIKSIKQISYALFSLYGSVYIKGSNTELSFFHFVLRKQNKLKKVERKGKREQKEPKRHGEKLRIKQ